MRKKIRKFFSTVLFLAAAALPNPALAQTDTATFPATNLEKPLPVDQPRWEGTLNSGYVGSAKAKYAGADAGNSGAYDLNLELGTRVALNQDWFLNLGITSENLFFDQLSGAPIPDRVNTLRFNAGLGYRINSQWTVTALLSPSLYRFDDLRSDDFGLSGGALATYQSNPSLIWSFGLLVTPDGDIPVFPLAGLRWKIDERSSLEVGVPKTRYTFKIQPRWAVYGGLDVNGTTFRTGQRFGSDTGLPQYNNALATYHDVRLGAGTSYELIRGLRAELEAGISVYREINYERLDNTVRFDPAPYVRVGLAARF